MSRTNAAVRALKLRARRLRPRAGILMYHCVCTEPCDPWALCVSPESFAEQMEVLSRARAVVDLTDFGTGTAFTRAGSRLAVTFDDGYVDNLTAALPVLERYEIPATIFVVGNAVGRRREFWWDALQRAVLSSGTLPDELAFPFGNGVHHFANTSEPNEVCNLDWRADFESPSSARQRLFSALWGAIVLMESAEQDEAIDHLLDWAGQPKIETTSRLPVDAEQFAEIAAHPLITLGSHTLDHVSLTTTSPERQLNQMKAGRSAVEDMAGAPVTTFAYPFGRFDAAAVAATREADIEIACTSEGFAATTGDPQHALPRLHATDMNGDEFARWLQVKQGLTIASGIRSRRSLVG